MRALLFVVACGAPQKPSSAPTCDETAEHLLALANRDNEGHAPPELAAGIRAQFARDCRDTQWSAERRSCITSSISPEATLTCPAR